MDDRLAFISEFKVAARRKGTTPQELFSDHDKDELGIVKYNIFRKILSAVNMWVREDRLDRLTKPYIQEDNFNYAEFLKTDNDLSNSERNLAQDDDIAAFSRYISSRSIYLQDTLEERDRYHFGHVSESDFYRCFGSTPLTRRIAAMFNNGNNEVEYLRLANEIKRVQKDRNTGSFRTSTPEIKSIPLFFSQVAYDINSQGVDPLSTFISLDKYKRGYLPKTTFLSAVQSFNVRINANQLCQLVDAFSDKDGNVPYREFCDEVAKSIAAAPPSTRSTFTVKGDINKTLNYLRELEKNRHSQIGEQLKVLDPRNTGLIQSAKFFKALAIENFKVGPADTEVLEETFTDGNGNIKYRDFLNAILPQTTQLVPTANQTIERLKNYLKSRSITLRSKFARIDRNRSGKLIIEELSQVLHSVSFDITRKEWLQLSASLGPSPRSLFDYNVFCDEVDPLIPEPQTLQDLQLQEQQEQEELRNSSRRAEVRPQPPDSIVAILVSILRQANRNHIDVYEELRSRDTLRRGIVPNSQFQSLLFRINPSLQPADVAQLTEFYNDQPMYTNYENMCKDITDYAEGALKSSQQLEQSTPSGPSQETLNVLRRLKIHLDMARIEPEELFLNYDYSKTGLLAKSRLNSVFCSINLTLNQNELQSFEEDFQDKRRPELVNYKRIIAAIRNTRLTQNDLSSIRIPSQSDKGPIREVAVLVNSIRERIQERHKRVRAAFADCVSGQPCSARDFRAAINTFGLIIREVDLMKLLKYYRVTRQGDVDWEKFCQDVETSKTVEFA